MGCVYRDEQMSEQQMTSHPLYEINPSKGSTKIKVGIGDCAHQPVFEFKVQKGRMFFFPCYHLGFVC